MEYKVSDVLIPKEEIEKRVAELGARIAADYEGQELVVVGILKGAVVFMADLVRNIPPSVNISLDFMAVSSYGDSTKTSGIVRIVKDLDSSIKDKNVLIVEDIVDTGLTLSYLVKLMHERQPGSVRVCALLDKEERRKIHVDVAYKGFSIPDRFVVGYGLDYAGKWRNLPSVHIVDVSGESRAAL
ncbi:Hypoxanthine phosphoribosyltransferase [bioreactor metagenome]|jgi:hypoxanthine phosphoribosyltransferase|uniref:hypoxanthine phosphoribosyltransferase n=1 Tax=bioreactor metagenome TaxID=1076179 RepID=A0A644WRG5_9ZZZZ|nr:hypoxanthine phosphoribosyltransferase [Aminivibrio sp.]MDD3515221.1 hypoxanthine phosphoribosyltransferase [Synergistaceae bacterium]MEA4953016.1 hypoxanthine phosphoribosyltransferase [Aminivibrio sp.]HPF84174.1 hypoxanthine phosphoribosyltransferase [Aminivibrio sp.]HPK06464.1 hypoxanthine phosphoribosyltransferase [Aminivibrio sp.]HRX25214.1 hypoxanthine phosphoribosyltransferase [Aminivibrio sp.]